jgi:hypothetical protein
MNNKKQKPDWELRQDKSIKADLDNYAVPWRNQFVKKGCQLGPPGTAMILIWLAAILPLGVWILPNLVGDRRGRCQGHKEHLFAFSQMLCGDIICNIVGIFTNHAPLFCKAHHKLGGQAREETGRHLWLIQITRVTIKENWF